MALVEGQSQLVNGGVYVGGHVVSDNPVQVDILTGDRGSSYESRDSALLPTNLFSSSYYTPVSTATGSTGDARTTVWLYNPGGSPITVNFDRRVAGVLTSTPLTVPAGSYFKQFLQAGSGAHFYTSGQPFYAFSTTDSASTTTGNNQAWDWGFSLVPQAADAPQVLVGLGIGQDPSYSPTENGNPVWVTPIGNGETPDTIYADCDANPTTGANTDPNGNKYDVSYSLKELEQGKVFVDDTQTGGIVFDATSSGETASQTAQ